MAEGIICDTCGVCAPIDEKISYYKQRPTGWLAAWWVDRNVNRHDGVYCSLSCLITAYDRTPTIAPLKKRRRWLS